MTERIGGTKPFSDVESVRLMRLQANHARLAESAGEGVTSDKDEVEISASAKRLQQAREAVEAAPETRPALVQRLRAQVESGEYQVDRVRLARRIVDVLR